MPSDPIVQLLDDADAAHDAEDYERALGLVLEAQEAIAASGEADHPYLVDVLNLTGVVLLDLERPDQAVEHLTRAISVHGEEGAVGEPSAAAGLFQNLGLAHYEREDYEPARAALERAVALEEAAPDTDREALADHLDLLGRTLIMLDRFADARPPLARAAAIHAEDLGVDAPETVGARAELAELDELLAIHAMHDGLTKGENGRA